MKRIHRVGEVPVHQFWQVVERFVYRIANEPLFVASGCVQNKILNLILLPRVADAKSNTRKIRTAEVGDNVT